VLIIILVHTETDFKSLFLVDSDELKQNMQAENLRQLENENDIGSNAYSTSLYVLHHHRASRSS